METFEHCWEWFIIGVISGVGGTALLGMLGMFGVAFKNMMASNQFSFMSFSPRPKEGSKEEEEKACRPASWFERISPALLVIVGIVVVIMLFVMNNG